MTAMPAFYRAVARLDTRHPILTIVLALLAVIAAAAGTARLVVTNDWDANLPNNSALTKDIRFIEDRFDTRNTLAFLITGKVPAKILAASCDLAAFLERLPGVAPGGVKGFGSNSVKYIADSGSDLVVTGLASVCTTPGGVTPAVLDGLGPQRAFLFAPGGGTLVYADLNAGSAVFTALEARIEHQLLRQARPGVTIAFSGQPLFIGAADRFALRMGVFFPIVMLIVCLLHWHALRSVQAVVIPIMTGFLASLAALGVYGWLRQPLDTYATMAPIVILAVGAGHSVQLLKRYMEELHEAVGDGRASRAENLAALRVTVSAVGPVLTIAVLGAAACLFALLVLDVEAIGRFGLIAGTGLLFALGLELTLIPAIRALLPPPRVRPGYGQLSAGWTRGLRWLCDRALTMSPTRLGAGLAALVAILLIGIVMVRAENSAASLISRHAAVWRGLDRLTAAGVGVYSYEVLIDAGVTNGAFEPRVLARAAGLETLLARQPHVRATMSAATTLGYLKCRFVGATDCTAGSAARRIDSAAEASQIWTTLYGNERSGGLIDASARYLRVRAFVDTDDSIVATALIDRTQDFARAHALNVRIGGIVTAPKALSDAMIRVSLEKSALLIAIVALIGLLSFRSPTMMLLFAVPSLLTVASNFAFLGWASIPLNHATAAIATIAVGIGVDYLIYLTFRLRERLRTGASFDDAMHFAHASAGGAAVCVGTAVAAGYAVLLFSIDFNIHQWIGLLVPLTMVVSLFGALFLFPFFLRLLRPGLA